MFARMYSNVMNRYHWMETALAMNMSYNDSGVFYLQGAAPPNKVRHAFAVVYFRVIPGQMCQRPHFLCV